MVKWTAVLFGLLALVIGGAPSHAQEEAAALSPSGVRLEVVIEAPAGEPIEQEMILLSIRGAYDARLNIALDALGQPELRNFGWTQLGRDRWGRGMIDGRQVRTFERRLAVFPHKRGILGFESFTHRLTLASGDGGRVLHEVRSAPVAITVQPKLPATGWWLPARNVRITDEWDRAPDRLVPGELAQRTVTLEAVGVAPQFLPPPPDMKGSGLIVFTDPEERSTRITPDGPVSRVRWRWTVRPASSASAELRPVTISWFDTGARQLRELRLPAQKVGFATQTAQTAIESAPRSGELVGHAAPLGWTVGLVGGLVLLLSGRRFKPGSESRRHLSWVWPQPASRAFRRAMRRGDLMAVRRAATQWVRQLEQTGRTPDRWLVALLQDLDQHLFARGGDVGRRPSQDIARDLLRNARR